MSNSLKLTLGYTDTDYTRNFTLSNIGTVASAVSTIKDKIKAVNTSVTGGTDGGMDTFFLSEDYDGAKGKFAGITAAQIITEEVTHINLDEEGE